MTVALLCACLLALALAPAQAQAASCAGAQLLPGTASAAALDKATLCLIDQVRAEHGLRALRANRTLRAVATAQVTSMVRANYFADIRPTGQTPMSLIVVTHYPAHAVGISIGQNIAWGTGTFATPEHIVAEWMASPPHRRIMLSSEYRDAGVAVSSTVPSVLDVGHLGGTYAVEFGVRRF